MFLLSFILVIHAEPDVHLRIVAHNHTTPLIFGFSFIDDDQ